MWPGIADGGAVLDANVPGGLVNEVHVNQDPRICALWDAVAADGPARTDLRWRRRRWGV